MKDEALKLALEALESFKEISDFTPASAIHAITAIKQALEAPVQEPVAWHHKDCEGKCIACLIEEAVEEAYGAQGVGYLRRHVTITQPQRTWVGLTDEEIQKSYETTGHYQTLRPQDRFAVFALARAIEAKLKEKNT